MDWRSIFYELVEAEDESTVTDVLSRHGLLAGEYWLTLGGMENNFGIVGNQQSDPAGSITEKVMNSIDSVLMAEAFKAGIDPEGPKAPKTMTEAVEQFFGIRDGRLENLTAKERTALAKRVQMVAVGSKASPSYLIIDDGEGQTPRSFPETFLSLAGSMLGERGCCNSVARRTTS